MSAGLYQVPVVEVKVPAPVVRRHHEFTYDGRIGAWVLYEVTRVAVEVTTNRTTAAAWVKP